MITCLVCKGSKTDEYELPCPFCNGKGEMTKAKEEWYIKFAETWCTCSNITNETLLSIGNIYKCPHCNKIIQIGKI